MPENLKQDRNALEQRVQASLQKAEKVVAGFRKTSTRLFVTGIISSGVSTLVAGFTAAGGPLIGEGTDGWRIACITAAIFGFVSTVISALSQQLNINDRLSEGRQCVGKLRYLDLVMATGGRGWEEIAREYEELVKTYPALIC